MERAFNYHAFCFPFIFIYFFGGSADKKTGKKSLKFIKCKNRINVFYGNYDGRSNTLFRLLYHEALIMRHEVFSPYKVHGLYQTHGQW